LNKYFVADTETMPLILKEECKGFVRNKRGKLIGKKFDDLLFSAGVGLLGLATLPDMIIPDLNIEVDERIKLLESMKNLTTDKKLARITSERYMVDLKDRLFGAKNASVTNLTKDDLKKIAHLLPA